MDLISAFNTLSQAFSGYKAAVDVVDEAKIAASQHEIQVQLIELGVHIRSTQKDNIENANKVYTQQRLIQELETQIVKLEEKVSERERYELVEGYPGTYVLKVKESCRNGEPDHYLCPGCLDNESVKSILQYTDKEKVVATCTQCKVQYQLGESSEATDDDCVSPLSSYIA